ncbi:MAG: pro-sigmaK processing inhibitor BofA family protein [Oscillospiraceae bacterium]|nr:pro-sigmaK processing inhibitor BofA family protein [Oscillospiraceae bacterium]
MQSAKVFLGIIFFLYLIIVLITYIKSKRFFTAMILTALQGLCALFAVNFIGGYLAVHIPVNGWTMGLSSVGGISGVIMILLSDIFLS